MHNPEMDGVDHINIYSKGKTELGRKLSNWFPLRFTCEDGDFASIEGYWYWLGTHNVSLRSLSGYQAKEFGKSLPQTFKLLEVDFRTKIKKAINIKLLALRSEIIASTLPFAHYYVYGNKAKDAGYE